MGEMRQLDERWSGGNDPLPVRTAEDHDLIRWFDGTHLQRAELRLISANFARIAHALDVDLPNGAEKTVALRKLLESKDAAVRSMIDKLKS